LKTILVARFNMKICDYCGKENENTRCSCAGCGKNLETPVDTHTKASHGVRSLLSKLPRSLDAASATIVLLAEFSAQFGSAVLVAIIAGLIAMTQMNHTFEQLLDSMRPALAITAPLVGLVAMVLTSSLLFPNQIKDTSPTGAAWSGGHWLAIAKSLAIGLALSICFTVFRRATGYHADFSDLKDFDRMARAPGLPRITWLFAVVLLAPPAEELLFRGVLYGGYRKSFGPIWALVLSTGLFLMGHYAQMKRFPLTIVGLTGLSLAALWCRLRSGGVGAAIAVHVGYNAVPAFSVLYT
jgi:membrane protease YdiL (CAAX protease family)